MPMHKQNLDDKFIYTWNNWLENERVIIKEVTRKYGTAKNCLETWSF